MPSLLLLLAFSFQDVRGLHQAPGHATAKAPAAVDLPPVLTIDPGPFFDDPERILRVTVEDPEGGLVSLRVLGDVTGTVLQPALKVASPVTRDVSRARIGAFNTPLLQFVLEAEDQAGNRTREVVDRPWTNAYDTRLLVADVTGNGKPDVIGAAPLADIRRRDDAGELYVWADRETPQGAPTATLRRPSPRASEQIGAVDFFGRGIELFDLDADGVLDVVAFTTAGPTGSDGLKSRGYVFFGGKGLAGEVDPGAELVADIEFRASPFLFDLTGDGERDLVLQAFEQGPSSLVAGALHVWQASSGAAGRVAPTHVLVPATDARPSGASVNVLGLDPGDLTGDGLEELALYHRDRDPVTGAPVNVGALHVWQPGKLQGARPPANFVREVPGSAGGTLPARSYAGTADLTGDGQTDLIATVQRASGTTLAAVVWAGGAAFVAGAAPVAELHLPAEFAEREVSATTSRDVTGDGQRDVIVGLEPASDGSLSSTFAVVWAGGTGLAGVQQPLAILVDTAAGAASTRSLMADVSGDGELDLIAVFADGIRVWHGGPGLVGTVAPATILTDARLGGVRTLQGLRLADLTGDGVLDVIGQETVSIDLTVPEAHAGFFVWAGPVAAGTHGPTRTLGLPGFSSTTSSDLQLRLDHVEDVSGDGIRDVLASRPYSGEALIWHGAKSSEAPDVRLRNSQGMDFQPDLADFTGDGVLDIWASLPLASFGGRDAAGAVLVWEGGTLAGVSLPGFELGGQSPRKDDFLGGSPWFGMAAFRLYDFDGDGFLDLFGTAGLANVGGVQDAGAMYFWKGPLTSTREADGRMSVPDAREGDQLGGG